MAELEKTTRRAARVVYDDVEEFVLKLSKREARGLQVLLCWGVYAHSAETLGVSSVSAVLIDELTSLELGSPFEDIARLKENHGYTS